MPSLPQPPARRHRQRRGPLPVLAAALLLMAGAPVALAQFSAFPGAPSVPQVDAAARGSGCLAGVPDTEGLGHLPGSLSQASTLFKSIERDVELDRDTTFAVISLASALREPVDVRDILTYREERVEVCVFDRLASLEGENVLSALALGVQAPRESLGGLVFDKHVVVRFESVIDQRVELDQDVAFAALALHGAGGTVALEDVLDIERSVSTERTLEVATDVERREALLALALTEEDRIEAGESEPFEDLDEADASPFADVDGAWTVRDPFLGPEAPRPASGDRRASAFETNAVSRPAPRVPDPPM